MREQIQHLIKEHETITASPHDPFNETIAPPSGIRLLDESPDDSLSPPSSSSDGNAPPLISQGVQLNHITSESIDDASFDVIEVLLFLFSLVSPNFPE